MKALFRTDTSVVYVFVSCWGCHIVAISPPTFCWTCEWCCNSSLDSSHSLSSQRDLCTSSKNRGLFFSTAPGSPLMLRTAEVDMKADEPGALMSLTLKLSALDNWELRERKCRLFISFLFPNLQHESKLMISTTHPYSSLYLKLHSLLNHGPFAL